MNARVLFYNNMLYLRCYQRWHQHLPNMDWRSAVPIYYTPNFGHLRNIIAIKYFANFANMSYKKTSGKVTQLKIHEHVYVTLELYVKIKIFNTNIYVVIVLNLFWLLQYWHLVNCNNGPIERGRCKHK